MAKKTLSAEERLASYLADRRIVKADLEAIHLGLTKKTRAAAAILGDSPLIRGLKSDAEWLERVIEGLRK
jgi:hypothetical protein